MRFGLVRNAVVGILAMGALTLGACNDAPTDVNRTLTSRLRINPSRLVVQTADSTELDVAALNAGGEPTFDAVAHTEPGCGGGGAITVIDNPIATSGEPPGRFLVIGGTTIGTTCVVVTSAGATDTVDVVVVPSELFVTSDNSAPVRAGDAGAVTIQLQGLDGSVAGPFDPAADVAWTSSNSAAVDVSAGDGSFTTATTGTAIITATWSGTAATGTVNQRDPLTADVPISVIPNVPASAALDVGTDFGAFPAAAVATAEVIVSDAQGNQNTNATEVTGVTSLSSDVTVATVSDTLITNLDPVTGAVTGVTLMVTVTAVGAGTANISGTAETSAGSLAWGPVTFTVLAPVITSIVPDPGAPAATVTITGVGLSAAGFATTVTADGLTLGNFTVVSSTQITAQMPTLGTGASQTIVVDVGGVASAGVGWTQVGGFDEAATEPVNDVPGTAPTVSLPMTFGGATGGADFDDFFHFTVSQDVTVSIDLSFSAGDFDLVIQPAATAVPADFANFTNYANDVCGNVTATGANPETGSCVVPAGDYVVEIIDFNAGDGSDPSAKTYTVQVQ